VLNSPNKDDTTRRAVRINRGIGCDRLRGRAAPKLNARGGVVDCSTLGQAKAGLCTAQGSDPTGCTVRAEREL